MRLQEASIGYTIPKSKLWGIADVTVSLVGRNLWMIYCKAPFDPESVASTGNNYQGIDKLQLKVIEATYDSYKVAENRPLFSEYGQVWDTWQNALLSWSAKKPANAEEAYKEVKASFDGMMANLNQ